VDYEWNVRRVAECCTIEIFSLLLNDENKQKKQVKENEIRTKNIYIFIFVRLFTLKVNIEHCREWVRESFIHWPRFLIFILFHFLFVVFNSRSYTNFQVFKSSSTPFKFHLTRFHHLTDLNILMRSQKSLRFKLSWVVRKQNIIEIETHF
jgi:hypothetical protein